MEWNSVLCAQGWNFIQMIEFCQDAVEIAEWLGEEVAESIVRALHQFSAGLK